MQSTTFTGAETSGYILNRGSGMMQSTTFTRAETSGYILNQGSGMMQSTTFIGAETSGYILNRSSNEEAPLLRGSLQYLYYCHHYSHAPMMSIDHTMSSSPHTLGGNMLTLKCVHLDLHGLNHIHTLYSYHISLTLDLHNFISTKKWSRTPLFLPINEGIVDIYYGLHSLSPKKG